jgi:hypothetical protein
MAEPRFDPAAFRAELRREAFAAGGPTLEQRVAELEAMVARLLNVLVRRAEISINDAREVHGLPALDVSAADSLGDCGD